VLVVERCACERGSAAGHGWPAEWARTDVSQKCATLGAGAAPWESAGYQGIRSHGPTLFTPKTGEESPFYVSDPLRQPVKLLRVPAATVVIVTRNRREHALRAIASAVAQEGDVEVVVIDDGSTDDSTEAIRAVFPDVRLVRFEQQAGYVVRRNAAARLATAPILVSIDDDAVFSSPRVVEQTLRDFDHPSIGAVAIPYVDVGLGCGEQLRAPDPSGLWITATFRGCAYAVRRDLFLSLAGFREAIVHQGEESDYCLRMLASGHVVRLGRADQIRHFTTGTGRDVERMDVYGHRNLLLWAFTYFPFPESLVLMTGYAVKGILWGFQIGRPRATLRGLVRGIAACWTLRGERQVLSRRTIRIDRRLRRRGPLRLDEIGPLPSLATGAPPAV
jgi:glycosyltransferase involved in cell wall biosynthesis